MANEYSKKTNAELIEILKSRSLPHTGKKADLIARLQEADKAASATPAKVDAADDVIDWDDDTTPIDPTPAVPATAGKAEGAVTTTTVAPAVGGDGAAPNPTVVPNQKVDIDPSTTHDLSVTKPGDQKPATEAQGKETESAAPAEKETSAAAEAPAEGEAAPKAPAVDYTIGLATTDYDAELAKRKARAAKFGISEDEASEAAQKAMERAKRFGTADTGTAVKGLDQALSSERPRKRGRGGDDGDNFRGKRRSFGGRGRGRGGHNGGRRRGGGGGGTRNGAAPSSSNGGGMSEQDRAALERRKARFAA